MKVVRYISVKNKLLIKSQNLTSDNNLFLNVVCEQKELHIPDFIVSLTFLLTFFLTYLPSFFLFFLPCSDHSVTFFCYSIVSNFSPAFSYYFAFSFFLFFSFVILSSDFSSTSKFQSILLKLSDIR